MGDHEGISTEDEGDKYLEITINILSAQLFTNECFHPTGQV
jgi:hypothetical protein